MTGSQRDLVRYRMERALETLQDARLMLENGRLHMLPTESTMPVSTRLWPCFWQRGYPAPSTAESWLSSTGTLSKRESCPSRWGSSIRAYSIVVWKATMAMLPNPRRRTSGPIWRRPRSLSRKSNPAWGWSEVSYNTDHPFVFLFISATENTLRPLLHFRHLVSCAGGGWASIMV